MTRLVHVAGVLVLCSSCSKPTTEAISSTTLDTGAPTAVVMDAARPVPSAWRGSYKSAAGSIYIPADWKVRWANNDAGGVGDGSLSIAIDPVDHRLVGAIEGPLGPATLDGIAIDGKLTANILRKDPTDRGFSGTLVGAIEGDRGEGTMRVSSGEASTVRTATFTLNPMAP